MSGMFRSQPAHLRKRQNLMARLTPNMERAKEAMQAAPLRKNNLGDFVDANGAVHLYAVVAGLARRNLAVIENAEARAL